MRWRGSCKFDVRTGVQALFKNPGWVKFWALVHLGSLMHGRARRTQQCPEELGQGLGIRGNQGRGGAEDGEGRTGGARDSSDRANSTRYGGQEQEKQKGCWWRQMKQSKSLLKDIPRTGADPNYPHLEKKPVWESLDHWLPLGAASPAQCLLSAGHHQKWPNLDFEAPIPPPAPCLHPRLSPAHGVRVVPCQGAVKILCVILWGSGSTVLCRKLRGVWWMRKGEQKDSSGQLNYASQVPAQTSALQESWASPSS